MDPSVVRLAYPPLEDHSVDLSDQLVSRMASISSKIDVCIEQICLFQMTEHMCDKNSFAEICVCIFWFLSFIALVVVFHSAVTSMVVPRVHSSSLFRSPVVMVQRNNSTHLYSLIKSFEEELPCIFSGKEKGKSYGKSYGNNDYGKSYGNNDYGKSYDNNKYEKGYDNNDYGKSYDNNKYGKSYDNNKYEKGYGSNKYEKSSDSNKYGKSYDKDSYSSKNYDTSYGKSNYGKSYS